MRSQILTLLHDNITNIMKINIAKIFILKHLKKTVTEKNNNFGKEIKEILQ